MGISQFPFAVEAVFAVGPYQLNVDRTSLKAMDGAHQHRPTISKPTGSYVPAYTFLDPVFQAVSAIWATDIDDCWVVGNAKQMSVVHNPIATNPLPERFLPATSEYVASACEDGEYLLARRQGRWSRTA
jgi:type I restriction enzyme S subunit